MLCLLKLSLLGFLITCCISGLGIRVNNSPSLLTKTQLINGSGDFCSRDQSQDFICAT